MFELIVVHISAVPGTSEEGTQTKVDLGNPETSKMLTALRSFTKKILLVGGCDMEEVIHGVLEDNGKIAPEKVLYVDREASRVRKARDTGIHACLPKTCWTPGEEKPANGSILWLVLDFPREVALIASVQTPMY